MRPFEIFFGIIFLLLSIFLFVCLLLTAIDKAAHSICGSGCGFVIDNPTIFNPVDSFLVILAAVFPLDYVVLVLLIAYMLFCTIAGIMKMGIRLLWVHVRLTLLTLVFALPFLPVRSPTRISSTIFAFARPNRRAC